MSAFAGCSTDKPLAILFYPKKQDAAFDLTDTHAQVRIKQLAIVYDVIYFKVNSIFKALKHAVSTAGSDRKFAHLEFAGHGNQTELIFNSHVKGGVISTKDATGLEELKALIGMVDPHGVIVTQSCRNGSTLLNEINLLQYIANLTLPRQRVIGASDVMNIIHMDSAWHFHFMKNLTDIKNHKYDQDVTCVYQKLNNGNVQRVYVECIDFLLTHMCKGVLNFEQINFCYGTMALAGDSTIKLQPEKFNKRVISHFSNLVIKKRPGTEWFAILNDLEKLSVAMGRKDRCQLKLKPEERMHPVSVDNKGIHFKGHMENGIYVSTYKFLLALSELDRYFDLIKMMDNGQSYDNNPAAKAVYHLTGHVWHSHLQGLGVVYHNIDLIKRSYHLIKQQGGDRLLRWFKFAFPDGCFEARINAAHDYFAEHLAVFDKVFNANSIFPDDTLSQFVGKCYRAFLHANYRTLGLAHPPDVKHVKYPIFQFLNRMDRLLQFIQVNMAMDRLPKGKFSLSVVIDEIKLAGVCTPIEELNAIVKEVAKRDFISVIKLRDQFKYYTDLNRLANEFPEQAMPYLKELGFGVVEAVKFCIDHKLRKINLICYGNDVKGTMIEDLCVLDITHISIHSYNVGRERVLNLAKKCPNLVSVCFTFPKSITDATLVDFVKRLPQLTSINLSWGIFINKKALLEVIKLCPRIISFTINGILEHVDDVIIALSNKHKAHLKLVDIGTCHVSSSSVDLFKKHCPKAQIVSRWH